MEFEDIFASLLVLLFFISPLILFLFTGLIGLRMEQAHYRSIIAREQALARLPAFPTRTPEPGRLIAESRLVTGAVVISSNPFRKFTARLRMIIGGRVNSFDSLMDRARREAMLRMKESVPQADMILNLRLETSTIASKQGKQGVAAVEVVASGTAIRYASGR